jgi:GTP cyclohydrolase-4
MVYRAHKNPQFMEDVVRDIVSNVYFQFKEKYPNAFITVETDSAESIHDFNIQAKIKSSFKDLGKILK